MNPVIIQVNAEGQRLISNVCDAALKQSGLNAFNDVSFILGNIKAIIPPQIKPPVEESEGQGSKKGPKIIPLKQPEKK
jgi:hypothetical protein